MNDVSGIEAVVERILDESLAVKKDERYLFFTDFNSPFEERYKQLVERRVFLHEFFEAFLKISRVRGGGVADKCESTRRHGGEPGENIWRLALGEDAYRKLVERDVLWKLKGEVDTSLEESQFVDDVLATHQDDLVDAIIAFPWYSVTHTRFTRIMIQRGCRFASMPMLTMDVIDGPMRASWNEVAATTGEIYTILKEASELTLTCPLGTDFSVSVGPTSQIHQDTGKLTSKGALGNLPAGEAYFVPAPESARGKLVFTSGPDQPQVEPTSVIIENGKVSYCENETKYSAFLDKKFQRDFKMRHVAEFGIGTNPKARNVGSMIEGEKIQGTVHVALGDDKAMGGCNEATEHWDHVLSDVTLSALLKDGKREELILNGRLLAGR